MVGNILSETNESPKTFVWPDKNQAKSGGLEK